jgi:hypothetical protein
MRGEMHTKILLDKPGGKTPVERTRNRWEDNIKMDFMNRVEGYGQDSCGSRQGLTTISYEHGNKSLIPLR